MTNIENKIQERKEQHKQKNEAQKVYKEGILKTMENRVMTAREVADELGIDQTTDEYFSNFLTAFCRLEGIDNRDDYFSGAKLKLARRVSDRKFVYYRKEDEKNLVKKGILGPEYKVEVKSLWKDNLLLKE